jgi:two-component system chemotaxis response regulator CheY
MIPKDMRILVVDDFQTMRRIIRDLLRDIGVNDVTEADDGLSAQQMLRGQRYDLMITDWNMPGVGGLDLVRYVRADPELAQMPVLMLTAEAKREYIVEAVRAGIDGYVIKPFTAATLKEKIVRACAERRAPA